MKKKVFSICLSLAMLLYAIPSVMAAGHINDISKPEIFLLEFDSYSADAGYGYNAATGQFNVDVNVDVEVCEAGTGSYGDHPSSKPLTVIMEEINAPEYPKFDFRAKLDMKNVRSAFTAYWNKAKNFAADKPILQKELDSSIVRGHFTVNFDFSEDLFTPDNFKTGTNMDGFSGAGVDAGVYTEASRTVEETSAKIEIDVNIPGKTLAENIDNRLSDLEFSCEGVEYRGEIGQILKAGGEIGISVSGESFNNIINYEEGYTDIIADLYNDEGTAPTGETATIARIIYKSNHDEAAVWVRTPSTGGNGGETLVPTENKATIRYVVPFTTIPSESRRTVFKKDATTLPQPEDYVLTELPDGVVFGGWFYDKEFTKPVEDLDKIDVDGEVTIYGKWVNTKTPGDLSNTENDETHYAYVIGYPEGDVRPENNITRDEVATIFYRLMNAQRRDELFTSENNFSDVDKSWWSNKAISTSANGGYVKGYEDGTFRPANPITRAEFATMAVRFANWDSEPTIDGFSDISGHWAERYIKQGVVLAWITGYEDGTFRPDQFITRAEAMTIFNRVLNRHVNAAGLRSDAKFWPDNIEGAWYYYEVEEATNSHDYTRQADQYNENWAAITENKIWLDKPKYEDPDR